MPLPKEKTDAYIAILNEELLVAMGCTEPIAIAYAASILRCTLGCAPEKIRARLSGNIIKNVKSVIVPATGGLHGIEAAVAAGIVAACPERQLEVLSVLRHEDQVKIAEFLTSCKMSVEEMESPHTFDLELIAWCGEDTASVRIMGNHTNVVSVKKGDKDVTPVYCCGVQEDKSNQTDRSVLNVQDILTFATETDLTPIRPLLMRLVEMNMAIAREGLKGGYGACIGKVLYRDGEASLRDRARAFAAAGSDARMSGCEMPVIILSGSGNQGITASVPVAVYAETMGATEEQLYRAVAVSDLVTVHQKTGIGRLSAYCGAISAGCGAGAGIAYLHGGRKEAVAHTVVNAIAILSGTICDGAKPSCAAKIAAAVDAGILGYNMFLENQQFYGGDGIVTKGADKTVSNVGRLAREGMRETDRTILEIMLSDGC